MNLDTFVKETLVAIANGIYQAQQEIAQTRCPAKVNPQGFSRRADASQYAFGYKEAGMSGQYLEAIHFDVAVIAESEHHMDAGAKGSIGGGIKVLSVDLLSGKGETEGSVGKRTGNSSVSRIKFIVPMLLPEQE